jgi:hypothetical protein
MTEQPEALRLADALRNIAADTSLSDRYCEVLSEADDELRRLHHNNRVLNNALWRACGDDYRAIEAALAEPEQEPLSDDELDRLWREPMSADWEHREYARAIKAAHGADLERFAALVRSAEREACAKVAKETVCDMHLGTGIKIYGTKAAAAIRARGNP